MSKFTLKNVDHHGDEITLDFDTDSFGEVLDKFKHFSFAIGFHELTIIDTIKSLYHELNDNIEENKNEI